MGTDKRMTKQKLLKSLDFLDKNRNNNNMIVGLYRPKVLSLKTGLSTPTEHPQNSRSYFVSSKLLLSYHYVHLMVLMYSMGISSVNL